MTHADLTERLVLASSALRMEVLPSLGAKIGSLRLLSSGEELLQQPLRPYAPRTREMAFEAGDASGIDECIPSVSGCTVSWNGSALEIPDHGDFWRIPFSWRQDRDRLVFAAEGYTFPLRFEKRLHLEGDRLTLSYRLENMGENHAAYLWSAHPGFAVDEGDRIELPASVKQIKVWYSEGKRLGDPGQVHPWPHTRDNHARALDLTLTGGIGAGVGDKVFLDAPAEGWIGLHRRRLGRRIEVRFDPSECPYAGLWMAYGGWPPGQARRQHCVALEPCTAPVDALSVAVEHGWTKTLAPGESRRWRIEIRVVSA